ncbi:MAG: protein kinase [Myxococcota bacterium]
MGTRELEHLITRFAVPPEAAAALRAWYAGDALVGGAESDSDDSDGPLLPERYAYVGLIGMGGMGEVHRVKDLVLARTVAMKILRQELAGKPRILARFEDEAIATAQLEHPGIVPVYDFGLLPDGRTFFTMQEIKGDTLTALAYPVHTRTFRERRWARSNAGWTLTRLLDVFRTCCQAVAHAHARGVLHRDLKPDNLMIGTLGEVLVVDWGLAKVGSGPEPQLESVTLKRSGHSHPTRIGTVAGTPAYMAPEQAHGRVDQLAPPSDVYALGSILYFLLAGRPPYEGDAQTALSAVRSGPPEPLAPLAPVSDELLEICERAMAREPADRYPDAAALAEALLAYEDGAARRTKALALVQAATDVLPELWSLRQQASAEEERARQLAAEVKGWQPPSDKQALWDTEDRASALHADAELAEYRTVQLLRGALTHEPEMPEAHAVLADLYRQRHEEAELHRNASAARRYALLLADHDRSGLHSDYLRGDGFLTLHTDVPATVRCSRYVERGRRLVEEPVGELGITPLDRVPLERGSYLLELTAPGRHPVRYPVLIERLTHWDGIPPGADSPAEVRLPAVHSVTTSEVVVPAGWFWAGGDSRAGHLSSPLERVWVEGFSIRRHPVTNAEYPAFLNSLVESGRARRPSAGPCATGASQVRRSTGATPADASAWSPTPTATCGRPTGPCSSCRGRRRRPMRTGSPRRTASPGVCPLSSSGRRQLAGSTVGAYPGASIWSRRGRPCATEPVEDPSPPLSMRIPSTRAPTGCGEQRATWPIGARTSSPGESARIAAEPGRSPRASAPSPCAAPPPCRPAPRRSVYASPVHFLVGPIDDPRTGGEGTAGHTGVDMRALILVSAVLAALTACGGDTDLVGDDVGILRDDQGFSLDESAPSEPDVGGMPSAEFGAGFQGVFAGWCLGPEDAVSDPPMQAMGGAGWIAVHHEGVASGIDPAWHIHGEIDYDTSTIAMTYEETQAGSTETCLWAMEYTIYGVPPGEWTLTARYDTATATVTP